MKSFRKEFLKLYITIALVIFIILGSVFFNYLTEHKKNNIKNFQLLNLEITNSSLNNYIKLLKNASSFLKLDFFSNEKKYNFADFIEENPNSTIIAGFTLNEEGIVEKSYLNTEYINNINSIDCFDLSSRLFFKKTLDTHKSGLMKNYSSFFKTDATIIYSTYFNHKFFIIISDFKKSLKKILKNNSMYKNQTISIYDEDGFLLLDTNKQNNINFTYNDKTTNKNGIFNNLIKNNNSFIFSNYYSKKNIKMLATYSHNEQTNLYIVSSTNFNNFTNALLKEFIYSSLILIIILIIIYILSTKLTNNINNDFKKIINATIKIKNNDYSYSLNNLNFTESNNIAKNFNIMKNELEFSKNKIFESLNNFKKLFNSSLEGYILTDKNGKITKTNKSTLKLIKEKRDFFIGKNITKILFNKNLKTINIDQLNIPTEKEFLGFIKYKKTILNIIFKNYKITLNNKNYILISFVNVTELRKKDELFNRNSKMIALSEMINNISHQWRQPLNIISSSAGAISLKKECDILSDNELNNLVSTIENNTLFLSNTIEDFKNFINGTNNEIINFNVSEKINKILLLINPLLKKNNIQIIKDYSKNINIDSNPNIFNHAIINIINNAKDALIDNKLNLNKKIKISVYKEDLYIKIKILDNAGGIPENIKNKIFNMYFTTKNKTKGTGIGLYMTKQIIEDHLKGKIEAKNDFYEKDTGAAFIISLPKKSNLV